MIRRIVLASICVMLFCMGCSYPVNQETIKLIYDDGDAVFNETCAMYDLLPSDFNIESIQYGSFNDAKDVLVVLEVDANKKALEMSINGDVLKVFAVFDDNLSELKGPAFSVVADEVNYNIISFPKSNIDYLFINAIDIAAGPEEFVGGLYNTKTWENMFPLPLQKDTTFLPIVIGNRIYLSTISEMDIEKRLSLEFDIASESIAIFDPEQDEFLCNNVSVMD